MILYNFPIAHNRGNTDILRMHIGTAIQLYGGDYVYVSGHIFDISILTGLIPVYILMVKHVVWGHSVSQTLFLVLICCYKHYF